MCHLEIVFRVQGENIPITAFDEVIGGNENKLASGMKELELVLYRPDAEGKHFGIFNTGEFIELDSYVNQIEVYIIKHENEGVEAGLIHGTSSEQVILGNGPIG